MTKKILVGVWRGNNIRSILMALEQIGHSRTTIKIYKGRLQLKSIEFREVIPLGEQIWLHEKPIEENEETP